MLKFLKKEVNSTYTLNGAATYKSTMSECLDLFYYIGALRNANADRIKNLFLRAYTEDSDAAMKILFYARDIRGGLGERKVFRICMNQLAKLYPESVLKNLSNVAAFGRYDDLFALLDTPCEEQVMKLISNQLSRDIEAMNVSETSISLLAKWMPSINASSSETIRYAKKFARYMKITDSQYRKTLAKLRNYIDILENHLRERDYTFPYESQPSKAMFKYKKAFIRNDEERYTEYLSKVEKGEAVLHTGTLYPYDIIREALKENITFKEARTLNITWNNLSDIENNQNAIAVIDGSGSMYWGNGTPKPFEAALSLGIYFAERNNGPFANHFITFSKQPQLVKIKGKDIVSKVRYVSSFNEVANTDIEAVFQLILQTAVKNRLPQSELPDTIYIISDMEFDQCAENGSLSNYENARKMFEKKGYRLPNVVFWNVNCLTKQVPVKMHDTGTALVSGATPKIFEMIQSGEIDPMKIMLDKINEERYSVITA